MFYYNKLAYVIFVTVIFKNNIYFKIEHLPTSMLLYTRKMNILRSKGYNPVHTNFHPSSKLTFENTYKRVKVYIDGVIPLVFGISIHAYQRMVQRGVNLSMLRYTIENGTIEHEGPQRLWDNLGRKIYTYLNMIIITNFEQNRIVTVYWKIPNWCEMERGVKLIKQKEMYQKWIKDSDITQKKQIIQK